MTTPRQVWRPPAIKQALPGSISTSQRSAWGHSSLTLTHLVLNIILLALHTNLIPSNCLFHGNLVPHVDLGGGATEAEIIGQQEEVFKYI